MAYWSHISPTLLSKGFPTPSVMCKYSLLSKGPPTVAVSTYSTLEGPPTYVNALLSKGPPTATVMCKYSVLNRPPPVFLMCN